MCVVFCATFEVFYFDIIGIFDEAGLNIVCQNMAGHLKKLLHRYEDRSKSSVIGLIVMFIDTIGCCIIKIV